MPCLTDALEPFPCIIRLNAPADLQDAAQWRAVGATAVLMPDPYRLTAPVPHVPDTPPQAERLSDHVARSSAAGLRCYAQILLDPQRLAHDAGPHTADAALPQAVLDDWQAQLSVWADCGVAGFCFVRPQDLSTASWRALFARLRAVHPDLQFIAWTPGMNPGELEARRDVGFDWTVSSLAWWDDCADWLAEEDARLRDVAPVLAYAGMSEDPRRHWAAAVSGDGMILDAMADPPAALAALAAWRRRMPLRGALCAVGGRAGRATALVRRQASGAKVMLAIAPDAGQPALLDLALLAALMPPGMPDAVPAAGLSAPDDGRVPAGGCVLLCWSEASLVRRAADAPDLAATAAPGMPRIVVDDMAPAVNEGAWPVKRIAHEPLRVDATVFMDGAAALAADLCWRARDEQSWRRVPMVCLGNDRWRAECRPERAGAHEYCVLAWVDVWAGFRHEWRARLDAGQDLSLSLQEAVQWLAHVLADGAPDRRGPARAALGAIESLRRDPGESGVMQELLSEHLAAALRDPGIRPFAVSSPRFPLQVDRGQARYGSWYELFPRSQSPTPGRHGTFEDVIRRLPDIRSMGFDVLYLTPIHPIGHSHRKGRNNRLEAEPGDVGSPYAIGSPDGGHDAVESRLGTLADFDRLVRAAHAEGLEIALDFAIQCSPDHPWLRRHPEWFSWRPDGSLRHAENPPKKYEDIVNVEFYGGPPQRACQWTLWRALRDIVLFWIQHGVRIFRVDNPHTKPLPFWQWLIAEVHDRAPDTVFLSEAFTRPAMMYRLAKIGFTQSYTYFTWRNAPGELDAYLQELSRPPVAEFFRPHFFVNTPDINPYYLQHHGRPGFLARAALAATTAGLWGLYSGFELCEADALAGREEYVDSEKYQLRQRDWHAPGNIRAEITRLNQIRRANPALQSHRGYHGLPAEPGSVLAYLRRAFDDGDVLLVMVNLDPEQAVHAEVHVDGAAGAVNLLTGHEEAWPDDRAWAYLVPEAPYGIWRLSATPLAT